MLTEKNNSTTIEITNECSSRDFKASFKDHDYTLTFETSEDGLIDSHKYTIKDVLYDDSLRFFPFEQRVEMMSSWFDDLIHNKHAFFRNIVHSSCGAVVKIEDPETGIIRDFINYSSNDYLNLQHHPRVKLAALKALEEFGLGAGASSTISGTTRLHHELEDTIARMKGCESALIQASGYATNLGVMKAMMNRNDIILFDLYAHASLIDGFTDSSVNKVFFNHNDMENLEYFLKRCKNDYVNKLIVVEGVYSMDWDIAPLDKIVELARKYKAWVLVDEAHATGVLGNNGHGTLELFGLEGQVDIVTGTLSKALGSIGGFVAGNKKLINYLQCANRSFVFSTSPFVPAVAAVLEGLRVVEDELFIRRSLWLNIYKMRDSLRELGFNIGETNSPIIPIIIGDSSKVIAISNHLREEGIYVVPIVYPVVARDKARLRISITAEHTNAQIRKTVNLLETLGVKYGLIPQRHHI